MPSFGIDRFEAPGRTEQQPGGIDAASLVEGDLPAQAFHLRGLQLIDRLGFRLDQQAQRGVGRAGVALDPAPASPPGQVIQQRGLPHPRLAADHEHPALTGPHRVDETIEHAQLG
jgi:hypothetical protein